MGTRLMGRCVVFRGDVLFSQEMCCFHTWDHVHGAPLLFTSSSQSMMRTYIHVCMQISVTKHSLAREKTRKRANTTGKQNHREEAQQIVQQGTDTHKSSSHCSNTRPHNTQPQRIPVNNQTPHHSPPPPLSAYNRLTCTAHILYSQWCRHPLSFLLHSQWCCQPRHSQPNQCRPCCCHPTHRHHGCTLKLVGSLLVCLGP